MNTNIYMYMNIPGMNTRKKLGHWTNYTYTLVYTIIEALDPNLFSISSKANSLMSSPVLLYMHGIYMQE